MNGAEIHLMLNHVPILGAFVGLALLAWGILRDQETVVRTALVLLVVFTLAGVATYLSGEPAEEIVEDAAGVSDRAIHEHEEFALWGLIGSAASGLLALGGLVVFRGRPIGRGFALVTLLVTAIAAGALSYTAYLGGRIRHPEIRSGSEGGTGGEEAAGPFRPALVRAEPRSRQRSSGASRTSGSRRSSRKNAASSARPARSALR